MNGTKRAGWMGVVLAVALAGSAQAGTLGLSWNAAPGAAGYKVYYGTQSGVYTSSIDVKNVTSYSISTLSDCTPWFLAVKAYNYAGESPTFSEEVTSWPRPSVTSASPRTVLQGDQVVVTVTGNNFEPGSGMTIDNPRVHLSSVSMLSCTSAQALVTIDPPGPGMRAAEIGQFDVTVTNPHAVVGSKLQYFEVAVDPSRYDVNQSEEATAGRLDGMDTVWLSRLFGNDETDALWDPDFDFDGDGWIDGSDLAYLASNLGKCWSGTGWTAQACN